VNSSETPSRNSASADMTPAVSVVMSVYNGATTLAATMDSVLSQEGVDFEFIVIDDGSGDGSEVLLDGYSRRDDRVRVIHQDHKGLTPALIRGCSAARGKYLARQDAGDESLAGRLARQWDFLEANPSVVLTSVGTRFIGPEGEFLYDAVQVGDELQRGLEQLTAERLRGPSHHGSTMFRQAAYKAVGGYRDQFFVAQDLDLWTRLAEAGRCVATPEVLYEATWQLGALSHLHRRQQVLAVRTICACRERRRRGQSEQPVLGRLGGGRARPVRRWNTPRGLSDARFHYFIGSLLAPHHADDARRHLRQAVRSWPWHVKAWVKLAGLALRSGR
jgi:glycosyltransferase involved in cell wall biosynthesis